MADTLNGMDLELDGKIVLVVGGTGLIGSAVVGCLRAEGAIAISAARSASTDLQLDASDEHSVQAGIQQVMDMHGRIDGLVHAAAPSARTLDPAGNSDPARVMEAVQGKALGFLRMANAVLPHMRAAGSGRIVGVSGQNALVTGNIAGSVRNGALITIAKHLADEHAGTGIGINTVSPGIVSEHPATSVAPGGFGDTTPTQVAEVIAFLLSPRAAGLSGESMAIGHRVRGIVSM